MKTTAIILTHTSTKTHIDYALTNIIKPTHNILLIYIQKDRMVAFADPILLFQSSFLYDQVKNSEKEKARIYLNTVEKSIKKRMDVEVCKMVVLGSENYKLECVLETLGVDCVVMEVEKRMVGKKLADRINEWGVVVVNVPKSYH